MRTRPKTIEDLKMLASQHVVEVYGIIDSSGLLDIQGSGERYSATLPHDIELHGLPFFHTHPTPESDDEKEHAYVLPTEDDVFETYRRFFAKGGNELRHFVATEHCVIEIALYGNIGQVNHSDVDHVISEIRHIQSVYSFALYEVLYLPLETNSGYNIQKSAMESPQNHLDRIVNIVNSEMNNGKFLKPLSLEMHIFS